MNRSGSKAAKSKGAALAFVLAAAVVVALVFYSGNSGCSSSSTETQLTITTTYVVVSSTVLSLTYTTTTSTTYRTTTEVTTTTLTTYTGPTSFSSLSAVTTISGLCQNGDCTVDALFTNAQGDALPSTSFDAYAGSSCGLYAPSSSNPCTLTPTYSGTTGSSGWEQMPFIFPQGIQSSICFDSQNGYSCSVFFGGAISSVTIAAGVGDVYAGVNIGGVCL